MLRPLRRETLGPGLHRYVFASASEAGRTHELLYDETDGAMSCLCDGALFGRTCKHMRAVRALRRESGRQ